MEALYKQRQHFFNIGYFFFLCFSLYAQLANSDGLGFQKSGFDLLILSFVADFSVEVLLNKSSKHGKDCIKALI